MEDSNDMHKVHQATLPREDQVTYNQHWDVSLIQMRHHHDQTRNAKPFVVLENRVITDCDSQPHSLVATEKLKEKSKSPNLREKAAAITERTKNRDKIGVSEGWSRTKMSSSGHRRPQSNNLKLTNEPERDEYQPSCIPHLMARLRDKHTRATLAKMRRSENTKTRSVRTSNRCRATPPQ
ncbi:hypothetical protein Bca52824_016588 [Brassica carinata]|uniref:Uncharacterized protein n=1 Tax=Brassica carinata TaxID=52824 RepID=A0A8X7W6Q2_BRACI|nr:hypothetical protein Bca52824_016588 [Brassica carinata]